MSETFYDFIKNNSTNAKFAFPEEKIQNATIKDCDEITTSFIRDEFERIGKESAWEFNDLKENPISKTFHSLILYYFGIATKNYFIKHFEKVINKLPDVENCNDKDTYWFEYIWRLTSFYHDVMTKLERDEKRITKDYLHMITSSLLKVENFLNDCKKLNFEGIKYTIYKDDPIIKNIIQKYNLQTIDCTYNSMAEEIINNYFRKRIFSRKIDHGIISGYVFYNQLMKNYLEKEYQNRNKIKDDGSFQIGNLNYRPEHLILFKYIADAIIVHNIWHYNDSTKSEYISWGLKDLSARNRLSIKKNPLAFMLGLLDTIEPTKFFKDIKPYDVLNNIDIEWADNRDLPLNITLKKVNDKIDFNAWFKAKFEEMTCWLDLKVNKNKDEKSRINEIIITIPAPKNTSRKPKNSFEVIDLG